MSFDPSQKDATKATKEANAHNCAGLHWSDKTDFANAQKGLLLKVAQGEGDLVITTGSGASQRTVWDMSTYESFQNTDFGPATVNPSLWRQAKLNNIYGLFEVTYNETLKSGIYQVRGYDLSNMTIVEAPDGLIVIDPLISMECAQAALELFYTWKKARPVVAAVIYTHSHVDHFGGVQGVYDKDNTKQILAPDGFLEHAASENVYAGVAMSRRAQYMYGPYLEKNEKGQVDAGLGKTQSTGTINLLAPTKELKAVGDQQLIKETVANMDVYFQLTPGTEAPAEMNFIFPDYNALCLAENATHNIHNILTLRGALVRDSLAWSKYLQQAIDLFLNSDQFNVTVAFAQHHWPTWDKENILPFLSKQRDLYRYMNDQTLRLLNDGYTGIQIAEILQLPPSLNDEWHCRGYYGSLSHNVKAIYQRYMGWFDGNPSNLWALPQQPVAAKYVQYMGGADQILAQAKQDFDAGNFRWVAEVLKHVVTNDPNNDQARFLLADTLEQLGYQAEAATWRNFFLMGALELRQNHPVQPAAGQQSNDFLAAMTLEMVFDALAVKMIADRAIKLQSLVIKWKLTDTQQVAIVTVENAALSYIEKTKQQYDDFQDDDETVITTRDVLNQLLANPTSLLKLLEDQQIHAKKPEHIVAFFALLDSPKPTFPIVIPKPLPTTSS